MSLSIVILAAGQGKRMHSHYPKVLHKLAGKTLLEHIVDAASLVQPLLPPFVIYGHQGEIVREHLQHLNVTWVKQDLQLGTGHAVLQALPQLPMDHQVLVLCGDVPLIATQTLKKLVDQTPKNALGIITAHFPVPDGLGRILRNTSDQIERIVEDKDATLAERSIQEINSGICLIPASFLHESLHQLNNNNIQKEYYLTDIIKQAVLKNIPIISQHPNHYEEVLGVNDLLQLAQLERFYQRSMAKKFMLQGLTLKDPERFDVRGELIIGHDVTIDINVIIEGRVTIGNYCMIGPGTVLRNVTLGDHVEVKEHCVIDGAEISSYCILGPFARIRPGTIISSHAHIGNFIEIKNSFIGPYTKINHVGYIGDGHLGEHVNIGAGTITCNYDGVNKHKTHIGDHAFIGSNTELVAPVSIGKGAYIGAGSTITKDAPAHQLTLARSRQRTIENWQQKEKIKGK